ncbi:leucine zipper domain-containing protein [Mycolicibacterium sp. OfavD-34-C]|uniref:leucine zipper domain-containing protein n=1 Tax=Mycolicibacterium sp. OfavD-34-C TaxID=2917746 RepID=UPI002104BCD9|nr:leucine zipper domain-containing protein [Mycolicibacterium sp. OfavD-34-C]
MTVHGRQLLVDRVLVLGRKPAHVADELGMSRQCVYRWVRRCQDEGAAGLVDRSSRPHRCPCRTAPEVEAAVVALRVSSHRPSPKSAPRTDPEVSTPTRRPQPRSSCNPVIFVETDFFDTGTV